MTTELWIALLTFLTSVAGACRWLIHVYWKQAEKIEELRNTHEKQTILRIEGALADQRRAMEYHNSQMVLLKDQMLKVEARIAKHSQDGEQLMKMVHGYIETTAQRLKKYETDLVKISNDLVMIKSRGAGGAKN